MRNLFLLSALLFASAQAQALNIFACEPEWRALAQQLAGERANVYVATSAHQDPHHVQARPSLISAIRRADLVVCTGAGLETGWLPMLLSKGSNPKVQQAPGLFLAAEQVTLLDQPQTLDRADGDVHASGNPHVHLDPRRILIIAEALALRLQQIDGANSEYYQQRLNDFSAAWKTHITQWQTQARALQGTRVIVHHRSWNYLLNWLGMNQVGELEPKPGLPPTPAHLAALIEVTKSEHAELIIYTLHNGDKAASWLAQRSDACSIALPFTVGGADGANSLTGLYDALVTTLIDAKTRCSHE